MEKEDQNKQAEKTEPQRNRHNSKNRIDFLKKVYS